MQLAIEKWMAEQRLGKKITPLFEESVKSYKAGAYKAGLLFSYLGFMVILKERLLRSNLPPGIPATLWAQIKTDIQNTETWDKSVYESTQRQQPAPIFPITDTLRREVIYWKDRRNDCAHFKHEKIDYHHVESFWSFLYTNLSKFTVNGGRDALLRKFKDHFDPSLTAPGTDITHLVREIENTVERTQLRTFYESMANEIDDLIDYNLENVFNSILSHYNSSVSDELIEYIKENEQRLMGFLRSCPQKTGYLALSSVLARRLWYNLLFASGFNDFKIYVALLDNNLIPASDIVEANNRVAEKVSSQVPGPAEIPALLRHGYFAQLKLRIFPPGGIFGFEAANRISPQILFYLEHFPIDRDMLLSLRDTFSHPLQPNSLNTHLQNFIHAMPNKKQAIIDVLATNPDIQMPERLGFIVN